MRRGARVNADRQGGKGMRNAAVRGSYHWWRMLSRRAALALVAAGLGGVSPGLADGERALGEYLSAECVTCHQISGDYQGIPSIIGWPRESFIEIMNEYGDKTRSNPVMQTIASRLSVEEIAALAGYFGSLTTEASAK